MPAASLRETNLKTRFRLLTHGRAIKPIKHPKKLMRQGYPDKKTGYVHSLYVFLEWYGLSSSTNCSGHGLRTHQTRPQAGSSIIIHARVIQERRGGGRNTSYRMVVDFGGPYSLRDETRSCQGRCPCFPPCGLCEVSPGCLPFGSEPSRRKIIS